MEGPLLSEQDAQRAFKGPKSMPIETTVQVIRGVVWKKHP